jgi:hypothetical protein
MVPGGELDSVGQSVRPLACIETWLPGTRTQAMNTFFLCKQEAAELSLEPIEHYRCSTRT